MYYNIPHLPLNKDNSFANALEWTADVKVHQVVLQSNMSLTSSSSTARVHCRPPVIVRTVAQTCRNLWWFHRCSPRTSCGYASYCADRGSDVQKNVGTFHSCSSWSMWLVSKFSTFSSPACLIVLMIAAVTWKAETRTYFAVWWIYILQM